jgi:2-hydroxy-3-keto-5-methylthiopentenyl-1-phosphate phosphatase
MDLGVASLAVRSEEVEGALHLHPRLSMTSAAHVAAARITLEWQPGTDGALRFLEHGLHAEVATGTRELDGEPVQGEARTPAPAPDRRDWHTSDLVSVVGSAPGGPACLVGVIENGNSFGRLHLRRQGKVLCIEVELILDAHLEEGTELDLGVLHIALGMDSSRLLVAYGAAFGRLAQARVWRPFLASVDLGRDELLSFGSEALESEFAALLPPREMLPIDVLVLRDEVPTSPTQWCEPVHVPGGLAHVAHAMDAAGFIPGLRISPFVVSPEMPASWRASGEEGGEVLDLSRAEVIAYLESSAAALCAAGVRYLEIEGGPEAVRASTAGRSGQPVARRLRDALDALRRGAGEEAFLLGVDLPYGSAVGVVDAMRFVPAATAGGSVAPLVRGGMSRAWMHRRLFLGDASPGPGFARRPRPEAEALAAVTATGGIVSVCRSPGPFDEDERSLLASMILETLRIDRCGIPGTLRLIEPLASATAHGFTARDDSGVYRGWVNLGSEGVHRVAESGAELRIGDAGEVAPGRRSIAPSSGVIVHASVPHPIAVFCDFDGTFSVQDVGATLAKRYEPDRQGQEWARYQSGEYTPWQYNMQILDGLPMPQEELELFLRDELKLDPGAQAMLDFCQSRALPFRILSDGFDWNIGRLQVLHGVSFDYEANRMHYQEGHWRIGPGAPDVDGCGCGTGVCKRGVLRRHRLRHPDALLVHIGNGRVSDTCGAIEADQAFAKDSLAPELERRGEPFEPFETLYDVIPVLERMLAKS